MRCIITDDEPFALKGIKSYVEKIDFLQLVGTCEDALQLNSLLKQQPADLLFLDIEMPLLSGIDFLQQLINPPMVVFTTAYEHYALKGYELNVVDYLVKPIPFERFLKAANKAYDLFRSQSQVTPEPDFLFVKVDDKLIRVEHDAILYMEARENYVMIYTTTQKLLVHITLKSIAEQLPASQFIQCHKSYVVNTRAVVQVEGNVLFLGNAHIPMSKILRDEVINRIVNNRLVKK
ncbi:LytTR family DNA-binding domain-containing protein [Cytophagaceae bacterium BD1B2-1]|uniref:LytTR family DNA-binding domain-containing protein n=2 Tax=Xanthocytophaga agilis TaxID=3048010 RepID=A0AAE3R4X6_9BACT|nr:LytTR family DNA-binding domain-containing protein [Xanthocytophaga agilis]